MKTRHFFGVIAVVAASFVATRSLYSEDDTSMGGGGKPSDADMWKMIAERAAPVEEHAKLAAFVGTWDADLTCVQDGVERKSKGTMTTESVLGGRALLSKFTADMDGHAFEGVELRGYDKDKKQNWSIWADAFGTGFMRMLGDRNADGNVAVRSDEYECMGAKCVSNSVMTVTDANHLTYDMTTASPGKPDQKMTIRYSRRK